MTTLSKNLPILAGAEKSYVKNVLQAVQALLIAILSINSRQPAQRETPLGHLETAAMLNRKADEYQATSPAYAEELRHFAHRAEFALD